MTEQISYPLVSAGVLVRIKFVLIEAVRLVINQHGNFSTDHPDFSEFSKTVLRIDTFFL